jgi:hypothetical protein
MAFEDEVTVFFKDAELMTEDDPVSQDAITIQAIGATLMDMFHPAFVIIAADTIILEDGDRTPTALAVVINEEIGWSKSDVARELKRLISYMEHDVAQVDEYLREVGLQ